MQVAITLYQRLYSYSETCMLIENYLKTASRERGSSLNRKINFVHPKNESAREDYI